MINLPIETIERLVSACETVEELKMLCKLFERAGVEPKVYARSAATRLERFILNGEKL